MSKDMTATQMLLAQREHSLRQFRGQLERWINENVTTFGDQEKGDYRLEIGEDPQSQQLLEIMKENLPALLAVLLPDTVAVVDKSILTSTCTIAASEKSPLRPLGSDFVMRYLVAQGAHRIELESRLAAARREELHYSRRHT